MNFFNFYPTDMDIEIKAPPVLELPFFPGVSIRHKKRCHRKRDFKAERKARKAARIARKITNRNL
jgi:hypothetical protein